MKTKKSSSLAQLARLMKPYWKSLLFCVFCVLFVNFAELFKPYVAEIIIDDFLIAGKAQKGIYSIVGLGLLYLAVVIAGAVFEVLQMRRISKVSQSILHFLRRSVFDRILHLSMRSLDENGTGRLITRATNDVETINEFYSDVFLNLFKDAFLLAGILTVMLMMDPMLALMAFTGVPVILLITLSLKRIIKRNFRKMKGIIGQINGFFSENISGMRLVQIYNRQKNKLKEFRNLNHAYFQTTRTQVLLNSFLRPSMEVINSLVTALLVAYGYHRITGGTLAVGVLYAFTNYIKKFFEPINDLAEKYTTVQSALISVERIDEILHNEEVEDPETAGISRPIRGEIEFKDVWFAYHDEEWVLKGVSFHVNPGEKISFVGATGAGKSTIINLISRYYSPVRGEILIDGIPVEEWSLRTLRSQIATVLQDVFLFSGTIQENLDLGTDLSKEALQKALEQARADRFVSLDDVVTEQGLNYSTGERQLLSFARAIAQNPSVLVLDEATAHIDSNTEEQIQESLKTISDNRTSVFIAHRLSTIRSCDQILYIQDGIIAEQGTHQELMEKNGLYARLIEGKSAAV